MIRILGLLSMFLLFLLPNSPVVFMPGQAWAACCGSTCKPLMCTCRGTYPCAYEPDDEKNFQMVEATIASSSHINADRETPAFTGITLDFESSFSALTTAGKCFRDKLAFSLLGNAGADLQFATFLTDGGN